MPSAEYAQRVVKFNVGKIRSMKAHLYDSLGIVKFHRDVVFISPRYQSVYEYVHFNILSTVCS